MIQSDFHTHTNFSSDSTSRPEDMIEHAISLGLERLCITDHMDYDFPVFHGITFQFDPERYFNTLEKLKLQYQSKIQLLIGIEIGLQPHLVKAYDDLINQYPLDFVIGSSHVVDGLDPYHKEYWSDKDSIQGITRYFESIIENTRLHSNFDIYGHLDYAIRYIGEKGNYRYEEHIDLIDSMLITLIQSGKGIECNTSGYKYGLGVPHPNPYILKRYKELGGEILTIGSDGHIPLHLAYDFKKAHELLLALGYRHYTIYEKREPRFIRL